MKLEKILKEDRRTKQITYEYILPDYEGTLKRVMMTDAKLEEAERSCLGTDIVLSGCVVFTMLYQTVDDELQRLSFDVPFDCSFTAEDGKENLVCVTLGSFTCLPSGPRRVNAKAEVVATLSEIETYEMPSLEEEDGLMTLTRELAYHTHQYSTRELREYAEEIYCCEGAEPVIMFHDAQITTQENRMMKDGVLVNAICRVRALLRDSERGVYSVSGEIPIEEFLKVDERLDENASVLTELTIASLSLEMRKEEGVCHLVVNPTISFFVTATIECVAPFVVDAYSTEHEVKLHHEEVTLRRDAPVIRHQQKLECRIPKNEGDPCPMKAVLFAKSEGAIVECTPEDGVVYLMLKLSHSLLGMDRNISPETMDEENTGETEQTFVRQKMESTHAINIQTSESKKTSYHKISSFVVMPPELYEEEDAFLLVAEVSFSLCLYDEVALSLPTSMESLTDAFVSSKDVYRITYLPSGATLWQIAKESHASIKELLLLNPNISMQDKSLDDPSVLEGVRYILMS